MRHAACAVTGHRPSRFKFKYSEDYSLCKKIKRAMLEQFKRLYDEQGVRRYYVGGALGVDMWAGEPAPERTAGIWGYRAGSGTAL